jgi:hypothetical protein
MTEPEIGTTPGLAAMQDRLAILDILYMHSRGLDRLDAACIRSAYWPDAEVDYGSFKGRAHDFAGGVVRSLAAKYALTQHCVGNTLIRLDAERARSESYVTAHHLLAGADEEMVFSGRYLDVHEKRGERWKMIHRQVVMDWSRRLAVIDERASEAFGALAKGGHGDADPLHSLLASSDPTGGNS